MKSFASAMVLFLIMFLMAWINAGAAELKIYTDDFPPVTISKDRELSGLGVEVVQEIMKRLNLSTPIKLVPWARGYNAAQEEIDVALFTTVRNEQREKLFKWAGPVTRMATSFYARKGRGIRIRNLDDAKKIKRIGVPRQFYTEQFLIKEGFTNLDLSVTPARMVKKMLAGRRHPVIVNDNVTLPLLLRGEKISVGDLDLLFTFMTSYTYIAFSLGTSDETVQNWQNTLNEIKKDGTFAAIYQKYLPGETPPGID
jgi:polar amino acid transport system substrate-binding protein